MSPVLPSPRRNRSARTAALLVAPVATLLMLGAGPAPAAPLSHPASVTASAPTTSPGASGLLSAVPDNGQRSFGVQPSGPRKPDPRPNFSYRDIKPGQRLMDHVAFVNISALPVTLTVYAADGYNTPAGAFDLLTQRKRSRDVGSWVRMRRNRVTVPARSAFITPIEIRVPRNAEPGDHAGGIVASLKTLAKDKKGNTVTVDDRVGTRMYIRVAGKLRPHVALAQNSASYQSSNPFTRGDAQVSYTIRNDGNVRLVGTKTIRVSDMFGGSKQAAQVPQMPELLPGYSFTFTTKVTKVLPALLLTSHITIDPRSVTGNVDPALEQVNASNRFWAMYWPVVGLLLLVALWAARSWWRRRNRRGTGGPGAGGGNARNADIDPSPGSASPEQLGQPGRTPAMSRTAHRALALALTGFAVVAGPALAISPAQAASGGDLTFVPGKGMDISPIYAVTSAPCPAKAPNLIGRMYGKGFPSDGIVVIPNGDASIEHDAAFGVPLQDTIAGFASEHGVKLKGKYTITVQCIDRFGTKVFSEFSGVVTFENPKSFTAPQPKTPPAEGVPVGFLAQIFPEFKAGSPTVGPPAPAPQPSAAATQEGAASGASADGGTVQRDGSSNVTPFLIIVASVLVLGGVGFIATRRPASPARPAQDRPQVQWPDEDGTDADKPAELVAVPDLGPEPSSDSDIPAAPKETN